MSEALVGIPLNPFNVALGVEKPFPQAGLQNAFALPGDVARANVIAPVLGGSPPPTPGQLANVELPVAGGTIIRQPTVDGLGKPDEEKHYWTGTDLLDLSNEAK